MSGHIQGGQDAALLHDIGKLGCPTHPLEAGPLSLEEFQKIRAHPRSAPTSRAVPFPYPVSP